MPRPRIAEELALTILDLRAAGLTVRQIARQLDCPKSTVADLCRAGEPPMTLRANGNLVPTAGVIAWFCRRFREGWTVANNAIHPPLIVNNCRAIASYRFPAPEEWFLGNGNNAVY